MVLRFVTAETCDEERHMGRFVEPRWCYGVGPQRQLDEFSDMPREVMPRWCYGSTPQR